MYLAFIWGMVSRIINLAIPPSATYAFFCHANSLNGASVGVLAM
jgi:hypothetical protein